MKSYIYRNINEAVNTGAGWVGENVFVCQANCLLDADEAFNTSGLTFEVVHKGKTKIVPASVGVENLPFISCTWSND